MHNWWKLKKKASSQLGLTLGKWLVLEGLGQRNEIGVKNDILNEIESNPSTINTSDARSAAINFYTAQSRQEPNPQLLGLLDQWLNMVDGSSISPSESQMPIESQMPTNAEEGLK